jgi:hypothetical protein
VIVGNKKDKEYMVSRGVDFQNVKAGEFSLNGVISAF